MESLVHTISWSCNKFHSKIHPESLNSIEGLSYNTRLSNCTKAERIISPTRSELYNYIGYLTVKVVHGKLYDFPGGRPSNCMSRATQPNHLFLDLPA